MYHVPSSNTNHNPNAIFWLWLVVHALITIFIGQIAIRNTFIVTVMQSVVIVVAEWLVLQRFFSHMLRWLVVTLMLRFGVIFLISLVPVRVDLDMNVIQLVLYWLVLSFPVVVIVGMAQTMIFASLVRLPWRWLVALMVGLVVQMLFFAFETSLFLEKTMLVFQYGAIAVLVRIVAAMLASIPTGYVLRQFVRERNRS
ncbi:MAG: hypothetical protein KAX40_11205 [Herpetosiphon sp.]|nr:hypothetical protein [Herpetosiphon sp.]